MSATLKSPSDEHADELRMEVDRVLGPWAARPLPTRKDVAKALDPLIVEIANLKAQIEALKGALMGGR